VTVTITNNVNQGGTATFQVTVSDPAVVASALNIAAIANTAFTQTVATFTDPGGAEPNASDPTGGIGSHYAATINWGDLSTSSSGTITFSNGVFTVSGSHTYTSAGSFQTTVTITHENASQTIVQGMATVSTQAPGNSRINEATGALNQPVFPPFRD
jgi:hypothetical protein